MEKDKDLEKENTLENTEDELFTISLDENKEEKNVNEDKDELFELEVKLQEKYVRLDQLEIKLGTDNYTDEEYDEYINIKQEVKNIEKEKKQSVKARKASEQKGILEQVSIWIIIYGIVMIILCMPGISQTIWFGFSTILLDTFSIFDKISMDYGALYYIWLFILAYAIPLLLHLLSWELYINFVKTKVNKWAFRIVWIIQAVLTISMIIYSIVSLNLFG